jgi:hypothetical protein
MTRYRNRPRLLIAAATLLLAGAAAGPAFAQAGVSDFDASVNCQAFQRWGAGGWTAVESTTMNFDNGMQMSFAPGDSFGPGETVGGMAIPVILDRHCGNR